MYEELVKALRYPCPHENCVLSQQAADAIENVSKAYRMMAEAYEAEVTKSCWIPVTERLPEAGERVMCYCRANIYEVMKMRTDGDWVHDTNHIYMHSFVTHWMPLPEPPKEET